MSTNSFYCRYTKRWLDIAIAGGGLALASPVLLGLGALVRVLHGSPVVFRQVRTGKDGIPFRISKFRTMTDERDAHGALLPDSARLTSFGKFLRKSSLDELPELWNVLTGDMSLVGPRPLLHQYMEHYTPEQHRRHELRPGITGWAAVNGRNTTTWEQRFDLDLWYVNHVSFAVDLAILAKTVAIALSMKGVDPVGVDRMPEYRGTGESPGAPGSVSG
ncbi:MAG: sugar transferase [Polyangiaceae bacterium]|nr:sugar transferase [Polyangiaceae bacterium]